ncbi:MAG: anti-sigma factor [Nitrospinota bacterium]|nr:anti-sigma factor [Nitrospinota bacterium]
MICCKECLELLHSYLEGDLEPKIHEALNEHFDDCPPCIAFLQTFKSTSTVCRDNLKLTDIPEEVQVKLRAFLNEKTGKK